MSASSSYPYADPSTTLFYLQNQNNWFRHISDDNTYVNWFRHIIDDNTYVNCGSF